MTKTQAQFGLVFAMMLLSAIAVAQQTQAPAPAPTSGAAGAAQSAINAQTNDNSPARNITGKERRRASELYLEGSKLFQKQQYDQAVRDL